MAIATVVATRRTSPRPVGSKLAVSESGELAGSVSGGCVESDVVLAAQDVLAGGAPRLLTYGITDDMALEIGLPCGGEIDVFVEPFNDFRASCALSSRGGARSSSRSSRASEVGAKLLVREDGRRKATGRRSSPRSHLLTMRAAVATSSSTKATTVFADVFGPPPRLLVYGAIDTAEALSRVAKLLGWTTIVADARARFATRERIPSADELLVAWPEEALERVGPDVGTAIVVLTHDDKFDVPMLTAALATEAFYVGALGSRRNRSPPEPAERSRSRRRGPRAHRRSVRPRHRRRIARGDGPLDDRGDARRARGRSGGSLIDGQGPHPRGTACREKIKSHLQHLSAGA